MPVGDYATFGECVGAQKRRGYSDEEARGICGKIEKQTREAKLEILPQQPGDEDKLFIKTFLIDASVSGNAWGVSSESIQDYIHTFIGRPLTLYRNSKGELDHPPDDDVKTVSEWEAAQEPFRIGTIIDVVRKEQLQPGPQDDQYFAIIEVTDPKAKEALQGTDETLYLSPGVADFHRDLVVNKIGQAVGELATKWEGMHLALVREPAYGIKKAGIIAKCGGDEQACITQLRRARLLKAKCGCMVKTALLDTSQVTSRGKKESLRLSEEENNNGKKEETEQSKTTTVEETKKVEESDLQKENAKLKQQIAVLETKLLEVGEQKKSLTARVTSLEAREMDHELLDIIPDENKRKQKIQYYQGKNLGIDDVKDLYQDLPRVQPRKARQEPTAEGRATLGSSDNDESETRSRAARLYTGGMY